MALHLTVYGVKAARVILLDNLIEQGKGPKIGGCAPVRTLLQLNEMGGVAHDLISLTNWIALASRPRHSHAAVSMGLSILST